MLEFFNQYELYFKLGLTILSTLGTLALLYFNYRANNIARKAVEEMQQAREEEYRPYVLFDIHMQGTEMYFLLKNEGKIAAFNVQFTLDHDWKIWNSLVPQKDYRPKDMAITDDIEMLAPGDDFREWVDRSYLFFNNNEQRQLTGVVDYENSEGKKFQFKVDVDMEVFAKRSQIVRKGFKDLVKSLEQIERTLQRRTM